MYALLDWDLTLRKGATVFTWLQFLVDQKVLHRGCVEKHRELLKQYENGDLSCDEMSKRVNLCYAESMEGMPLTDYKRYLDAYLTMDQGPDLPTTRVVTRWLREQSADAIVISGAPLRAIAPHFQSLGIRKGYALVESVTDGILDGTLLLDGGYNKGSIVRKCIEQYGERPALAMGDSAADIPMLRAAKLPVLVNPSEELRNAFPHALAISQDQRGARALEAMLKSLH